MRSEASADGRCVGRRLSLLVTASLTLGCSFEGQPSLGRYDPAPGPLDIRRDDALENAGMMAAVITGGSSSVPGPLISADSGAIQAPPPAAFPDAGFEDDAGGSRPSMDGPECPAGAYLGDFTCMVDPTFNTSTATAQVALTLTEAAPGFANAVADTGLAFEWEGYLFAADITGQLDCAANVFHADINGTFGPLVAPIPIPFSGVIDGEFDRARLSGTWSFAGPSGVVCVGTWEASQ